MSHRFISFSLYILGFMGFVMSLKRGYLKQQFGLFCWVHMSLLLIVVSRLVALPSIALRGSNDLLQPLHRKQHPRRHDLVLGARIAGHLQRLLRVYLGRHVRPHPAVQALAQEDR